MNVLGGIIGAVVGFFAGLLMFELFGLENRYDPIASGMTALFVFGPLGALTGAVLGTALAKTLRGLGTAGVAAGDATAAGAAAGETVTGNTAVATGGSVTKDSLKAIGIVVVLVVAAGVLYYAYAVSTATPWLNPNNADPLLQFEIRLAAGAVLPASPRDIKFELQTDINTMPGEVLAGKFRRDGEREVIVGEVDLSFRTRDRQLEVKIAGRPDRVYQIRLTDKAPHTVELGPWQAHPDGSEIRYRAKWPGRG